MIISYEILGLILTLVIACIKVSMDYSKLKARVDEQEVQIEDLKKQSSGIPELEKAILRIETKLDMIMRNFELTIKE